jgi:glutamyl-tRNA synthetase
VDFVFQDDLTYDSKQLLGQKMSAAESLNALRTTGEVLSGLPFDDPSRLEQVLRGAAEQLSLKPGQLFGILRTAVTGKAVTPPLIGILHLLGKEKTMARIASALGRLEKMVETPA